MNELLDIEKKCIQNMCVPIFGTLAQQNPEAILSINRLLNAQNFTNIIEFGTHNGGLSIWLALYCMMSNIPAACEDKNEPTLYINQTHHKQPKKFATFDITVRDINTIMVLKKMGATFEQLDLLNDEKSISYIKSLINSNGKTLVLADNGNKLKEMEIYCPSLKSGDIIMCHDWAFDKDEFSYNKAKNIWFGWETRWENGNGIENQFGVKDICIKNNIKQIYSEEFDDCAWFCGIKT